MLLVEDEEGVRALVRRILSRQGYVVLEAMTRRCILTPELAFLPKPFDVDDLLRRVRDVLDAEPTPIPIG